MATALPTGPHPAPELSPERVMAQAGSENFPVASRLLPRAVRAHLMALYGFARLIDDAGDEAVGDRLALLDALEADLERVFSQTRLPRHPLMQRLQPTVRACGLPEPPFRRLIEANRRDQRQHRYATFADLRAYCALSANPVGELVLGVLGAATPENIERSNSICTGLQLTEHWQDVAEDHRRGRVYVPAEDLHRFGLHETELGSPSASPSVRELMAFEVDRARRLLDDGAPLIRALRGRAALAIAAFVAGGRSALGAIERADYDVLAGSPRPGRAHTALELARTLLASAGSRQR
jgi:squalene synthase HpnC